MKIRLVKDIVIMLMALFALVSGSYISIIEIIEFYKKQRFEKKNTDYVN